MVGVGQVEQHPCRGDMNDAERGADQVGLGVDGLVVTWHSDGTEVEPAREMSRRAEKMLERGLVDLAPVPPGGILSALRNHSPVGGGEGGRDDLE